MLSTIEIILLVFICLFVVIFFINILLNVKAIKDNYKLETKINKLETKLNNLIINNEIKKGKKLPITINNKEIIINEKLNKVKPKENN